MSIESRKKYYPFTLGSAVIAVAAFAVVSACTDSNAAKPNIVVKDAPKSGVVAKVAGQEITEEELIGDDKLDFFELRKREYELRMERLNRLIESKLIGAEAQKANMSLDEYINKKITKGDIKISEKEYKKFVAEKKIPESQINPQIKERINSYLQSQKRQELIQAHLAKLTKSEPVEVYFKKPRMDIQVEVGENAPILGKSDAPVTIVEFSDFQCPFCSRGAETMHQVKKKYGNKVKIAFRHFPLPMHTEADEASAAAMCVHEQNKDKFWKYHDILFKNQDKMDDESLAKYAKEVGVDEKKFKECYDSKKYVDLVKKDMEYGEKLGVRSTPTFFVNGQLVSGALPIESFSEIIDEELEYQKQQKKM